MPSERVTRALLYEANLISRRANTTPEQQGRAGYYQPTFDFSGSGKEDYLCPSCFVRFDQKSALDSAPSGSRDDLLVCDVCGCDFVIPAP